jgi:hypothetical protein
MFKTKLVSIKKCDVVSSPRAMCSVALSDK